MGPFLEGYGHFEGRTRVDMIVFHYIYLWKLSNIMKKFEKSTSRKNDMLICYLAIM